MPYITGTGVGFGRRSFSIWPPLQAAQVVWRCWRRFSSLRPPSAPSPYEHRNRSLGNKHMPAIAHCVPHNKSGWDFFDGPRRWKTTVGHSSVVSLQWLAPNAGHPRRTGDFAIPPTLSDKNRDDQKHKDDQSRASPFMFIHKTRALVGGNASASVDAPCVVASRPRGASASVGALFSPRRLLRLCWNFRRAPERDAIADCMSVHEL